MRRAERNQPLQEPACAAERRWARDFCCYVPGGNFQQFRPGAGKRIPTEGYIAWGLHYTPIGKALADRRA